MTWAASLARASHGCSPTSLRRWHDRANRRGARVDRRRSGSRRRSPNCRAWLTRPRPAPQRHVADLEDRFSGMLQFGTAGLRGAVGAGPHRMNRSVVIRAAAGLARLPHRTRWAGRRGSDRIRRPPPLRRLRQRHRGRDGRRRATTQSSCRACFPHPMLAYATLALDADAGVMVTASHNPPRDNGYKVYLGGRAVTDSGQGSQIVPPYDAEIAAHIAAVASVLEVPRADGRLGDHRRRSWLTTTSPTAAAGAGTAPDDRRAHTSVVITSMHGVGSECMTRVLTAAGFTDVFEVAGTGRCPIPTSPPSRSPIPRSPGPSTSRSRLREEVGADVVVANDPDADRCAIATVIDGEWRMLHGDVVGLAAWRAASRHGARCCAWLPARKCSATPSCRRASSAAIAKRHGHSSRQHPHRLQVDQPRAGTRLRVRRGASGIALTLPTCATRTA